MKINLAVSLAEPVLPAISIGMGDSVLKN